MIALDTNIIIGLMVSSASMHKEVTEGVDRLDDSLCTTPTNIGEVLRLLTHPKVFPSPLKISKATAALSELIDSYDIRILDEDIEWWKSLKDIENHIPGLRGNEVFDARIAICLKQHKIKRIYTYDSDFKKYSFLQTIQPLKK